MNLDLTDPVALLCRMVQINSINRALPGSVGGEAALVDWLVTELMAEGLQPRRLEVPGQGDQLLLTNEVDDALPWLLFDSHLDTVAVEGMTIEPFGGDIRDGRIYGRGACDTKGTAAAMLAAFVTLSRESPTLPHNLALLLSVDEEVSMTGIQAFLRDAAATLGWTPAAAVVGEPTELRPIVAHNGCLRWTVTTRGKACHSAVPHEGRSAISAMVRVIDLLETHYIPHLAASHPLTGPAVCSINLIRGGSAPNIIPDRCEIEVDRRLVPGEDPQQVVSDIEALLEPLRRQSIPVDFIQRVAVTHPPLTQNHNGPLADAVTQVLAHARLPTLRLGAPFATHASHFDAAGIPTVVLGPGSAHTAHTRDEWVAVPQIQQGKTLYEDLMNAPLCG